MNRTKPSPSLSLLLRMDSPMADLFEADLLYGSESPEAEQARKKVGKQMAEAAIRYLDKQP